MTSFSFLHLQQVVKIPKVNRHFMDSFLEEEMDPDMESTDKSGKRSRKRRELSKAVYNDERFQEMFTNEVCISTR